MTEQVGRVVGGRYRLLAPLGAGASAEVYLADDVRLRRRVAVKLLHAGLADDEAFLHRFRTEARSAAALSHPNIVAIFDWNGDEAPPYLVTEYLSGGSLRSILDSGVRLSPSQALVVGLETAQALDHAHRQGFVHRDIKPANLLLGADARLRVADFGLARAVAEAGWTEPSAVVGTARYASPEQARGETLDGRSDVYSLALMLVEAVTGEVPFSADTTIGTLMARLDNPLAVPDELDALAPVVQAAGATNPADRPEAGGLVRQLLAAARQLPRPEPLPLAATGSGSRVPTAKQDDGDHTIVQAVTAPSPPAQVDATQRFLGPPSPQHMAPSPPSAPLPLPAPRRNWRTWAIWGLAAVVAVGLGVAGALFFIQASKPTHVVPEALIGAPEADITDHVGGFRWEIEVQDESSEEVEAGHIIRTDPEPGSRLREGERLTVVVSTGPPLVDVPGSESLRNLTPEDAQGVLGAPGLELQAEFVDAFSDDVEEGRVIGLAPDTPAQVPKGSTVQVQVSQGPGVTIPDVEGWETRDAREELEDLDLDVRTRRENSDQVEGGRVIRTEPGIGEEVAEGSEVVLVVSRGRGGGDGDDGEGDGNRVHVPDVAGMSLDDATEALEDEGLSVGSVIGRGDGTVQFSAPGAGSEVDEGSAVSLFMF